MRLLFTALAFLISISAFAQSPCKNQTSVTYHGYDYKIVDFGDQCWFAENCKYLPSVSPSSEGSTEGSTTDSYYYVYGYEGKDLEAAKATDNYETYGVLYNWPAVISEGICPVGWKIPSYKEFEQLFVYLGGSMQDVGGVYIR